MSEKDNTTRRSVLKSAGAALGTSVAALAATNPAAATHNEFNQGDIVSTDGAGVPGWETCELNNYEKFIDGTSGEIIGGPCYNYGNYWEVELGINGDVYWFSEDLLTNERDG
ncbi:hypothetical protein [Halorussus lipolyticus]|uniref:hypothetical protein n=1 Tax=Halorussus lipolyticus TaxID=3034024 RepID=UPI0023E7CC50|nr:hypothetical protein [Halorussus sp. DT80]